MTLYEFLPALLGVPGAKLAAPPLDPTVAAEVDTLSAMALTWPWSALGSTDRLLDPQWHPIATADPVPVGACGYNSIRYNSVYMCVYILRSTSSNCVSISCMQ
jgi:hypothetical protein